MTETPNDSGLFAKSDQSLAFAFEGETKVVVSSLPEFVLRLRDLAAAFDALLELVEIKEKHDV